MEKDDLERKMSGEKEEKNNNSYINENKVKTPYGL